MSLYISHGIIVNTINRLLCKPECEHPLVELNLITSVPHQKVNHQVGRFTSHNGYLVKQTKIGFQSFQENVKWVWKCIWICALDDSGIILDFAYNLYSRIILTYIISLALTHVFCPTCGLHEAWVGCPGSGQVALWGEVAQQPGQQNQQGECRKDTKTKFKFRVACFFHRTLFSQVIRSLSVLK